MKDAGKHPSYVQFHHPQNLHSKTCIKTTFHHRPSPAFPVKASQCSHHDANRLNPGPPSRRRFPVSERRQTMQTTTSSPNYRPTVDPPNQRPWSEKTSLISLTMHACQSAIPLFPAGRPPLENVCHCFYEKKCQDPGSSPIPTARPAIIATWMDADNKIVVCPCASTWPGSSASLRDAPGRGEGRRDVRPLYVSRTGRRARTCDDDGS
ncbi:hypothetical protein CKAH01_19020 [Colletotrichum kahawae]|uniref:Uncharacterized protein n=1 Tax=Colletotrichum kahawae TaxID=34407 RepID=A0AAD9Y375_COLKA|nr:hypothetical protein CKAH01_19020 [Colletotrichum kahawae]